MKQYIYADNAATTQIDTETIEAMRPFLESDYSNPSQPYAFSKESKRAIHASRKLIAECIGADVDEIFFTSGGTESDNWAIKGMMCYGDNRTIISSLIEHHAILNSCAMVERLGFPIVYLPVDHSGTVLPNVLDQVIDKNTKMVSIMLVNNEIGTVEPIAELAEIAHKYGSYFHTDAVQAVGHMPINVRALGVDLLSASAHKFNGPRGIGFLYVKKGVNLLPFMNGGSQEGGMRAGTENVAAIVGMAAALKSNCDNIFENMNHNKKISDIFLNSLKCDFHLNGSTQNKLSGINSISFKNITGEGLLHILDLKGICISTGSACNSVNTQISHVLKAIELPTGLAEGTIRVSFGKNNTEEDAILIAEAINSIVKKLK